MSIPSIQEKKLRFAQVSHTTWCTINSINTSKGITETPSATESVAQALSKPAIADSSSATDTGIGFAQDYVELNYLGEDYIGESWSFT